MGQSEANFQGLMLILVILLVCAIGSVPALTLTQSQLDNHVQNDSIEQDQPRLFRHLTQQQPPVAQPDWQQGVPEPPAQGGIAGDQADYSYQENPVPAAQDGSQTAPEQAPPAAELAPPEPQYDQGSFNNEGQFVPYPPTAPQGQQEFGVSSSPDSNGPQPSGLKSSSGTYYLEPSPIRIHVHYSLGALSDQQAALLKERLIPATVGVLQRAIKVRHPTATPLTIPRHCSSKYKNSPQFCHQVEQYPMCGRYVPIPEEHQAAYRTCTSPGEDACTTFEGGPGVQADFILYVSATDSDSCSAAGSAIVATGGVCVNDEENTYGSLNRPLAGYTNFCPGKLTDDKDKFGFLLDTSVHEVMHGLVFSRRLYEGFIDPDTNQVLGIDNVFTNQTENGSSAIITKRVQKQVQTHFDCPTAPGAYLENQGGEGTEGSHWEGRLLDGELMVGNSASDQRAALSNITLALLHDSGWYIPDYTQAGLLQYGRGRGCDFISGSCASKKDMAKGGALDGYFCERNIVAVEEQQYRCLWDSSSLAYCSDKESLADGCNAVTKFRDGDCTLVENFKPLRSLDTGSRYGTESRCLQVEGKRYKRQQGEDTYFLEISNVHRVACWQIKCVGSQVYVVIPRTTDKQYERAVISCPPGEKIDLADHDLGYQDSLKIVCPDQSICDGWGCPEANNKICGGHGKCWKGKCHCDVGYARKDCSFRVCMPGWGPQQCPKKQKCTKDLVCDWRGKAPPSPPPPNYKSLFPSTPELSGGENADPVMRGKTVIGRAYIGYLQDCNVYVDGNRNYHREASEELSITNLNGNFVIEPLPSGILVVDLEGATSLCADRFTKTLPRSPLSAPPDFLVISPITTLIVEALRKGDNQNGNQGGVSTADLDLSEQKVDETTIKVRQGLGIDPVVDLRKADLINEVTQSQLNGTVFAYGIMHAIANTVAQCGAFLSGVHFQGTLYSDGLVVMQNIAQSLLNDRRFDFTDSNAIVKAIEQSKSQLGRSVNHRAGAREVGELAARINKQILDATRRYTMHDLVDRMTLISYASNGVYVKRTAGLSNGRLSVDEYRRVTNDEEVERAIEDARGAISNTYRILDGEPPAGVFEDNGGDEDDNFSNVVQTPTTGEQVKGQVKGLVQQRWAGLPAYVWLAVFGLVLILAFVCLCMVFQRRGRSYKARKAENARTMQAKKRAAETGMKIRHSESDDDEREPTIVQHHYTANGHGKPTNGTKHKVPALPPKQQSPNVRSQSANRVGYDKYDCKYDRYVAPPTGAAGHADGAHRSVQPTYMPHGMGSGPVGHAVDVRRGQRGFGGGEGGGGVNSGVAKTYGGGQGAGAQRWSGQMQGQYGGGGGRI